MNRNIFREIISLLIVGLIIVPMLLSSVPITVPARITNHKLSTASNDNFTEFINAEPEDTIITHRNLDEPSENIYRSSRDKDNNKISDQLDKLILNGESVLDIIVMYNTKLTFEHIEQLQGLRVEIINIYWLADMVALNNVPIEKIYKISNFAFVERVENFGIPVLYSDIATPTAKARESELYSPNTAWELGYKGKGVNIAVVDTGVDNGHPSLAGKWLGGVDLSKPETFLTPRDGTFDADDTNGHGTTCSGIATGTGAPDNVYMGTAPEAKLVDVRIGTMIGYAPGELLQSYYDASLKGIQWVIDHQDDQWSGAGNDDYGIDILSLSWGIDVGGSSDGSDPYSRLLDRAVESGVIVCHAAGNSGPNNDGFDGFAAASNGISVAATDDLNTLDRSDDIIAEYSSRGPRHDNNDGNPYNELKPDISAPGTHIMQAQFDVLGDGSGNGYGNRGSGTSYATPLVAGVVALMLEANPNLTPELVKEILHLTAERRGDASLPDLDPFWNKDFGWGMVDAYKAAKLSASIPDVNLINVNLQCFIMEIEGMSENLTSGAVTIHGLAFSKDDQDIEKIELSVDDGKWVTIDDFEDEGRYKLWKYTLDTTEFKNGNHSVNVRAVNGKPVSLTHTMELIVENAKSGLDEFVVGQFSVTIIVLLIITVSVLAYLYYRKMKSKNN